MLIVNSRWTPAVNELLIRCSCGHEFWVRADRWHVCCPHCQLRDHLGHIRNRGV